MGSPDFAVPTFEKLIGSQHQILSCFTREAKPKNRGKKLEDTIIAKIAKEQNIKVFTPKTLRNAEIQDIIKEQKPDFLVVVAYGLILPQEILDIPKYGALNLHPSSLPRFRGAAPIQRTIMAGDKSTDICIMQMNENLDEGDILLKETLNIEPHMTAGDLHDKAAIIGSDLILKVIDNYDNITPQKQTESGICYANKISKEEAKIDFSMKGKEILNLIKGLSPYPGAYFEHNDIRYKVFSAKFVPGNHRQVPGTVSKSLNICCQNGTIIPEIIQKPGKKKMLLEDLLRGFFV